MEELETNPIAYRNLWLSQWVDVSKIRLRITDDSHNDELIAKIAVARKVIWTNYYGFELVDDEVPNNHPWAFDDQTREAVMMLVAKWFTNPVGDQPIGSVDTIIMNILGSRMNYG